MLSMPIPLAGATAQTRLRTWVCIFVSLLVRTHAASTAPFPETEQDNETSPLSGALRALSHGNVADNGAQLFIRCRHGNYVPETGKCQCDKGWKAAGPTDAINFWMGSCSQYSCQSERICQNSLGISSATCPIKGWNCYCGWKHAFGSGWRGYEGNQAKCMGPMFTFSVSISEAIWWILQHLWRVALLIALLFLPFGRKRSLCDHHQRTMWSGVRRLGGCVPMCRGECVLSSQYNYDSFQDDVAWSLYALNVMIWTYAVLSLIYTIVLFIWSVVVLAAVIIVATCVACGAALSAAGMCCDSNSDCGGCVGADCNSCTSSCDNCCCFGSANSVPVESDAFYWSGPFPLDPFWGYGGYGHVDVSSALETVSSPRCPCNASCKPLCRPLALLVSVFPLMPENAWGGLLGFFVLGTHQRIPIRRMYAGGNAITEFFRMGWRRRADLHQNSDWRQRVYRFILDEEAQEDRGNAGPDEVWTGADDATFDVVHIGVTRIVLTSSPFDSSTHNCCPSSFADYKAGVCWICQDAHWEWDLWISCGHMFCNHCSTQMQIRRMPCPLCRVASSTIVRGLRHRVSEFSPVNNSRNTSRSTSRAGALDEPLLNNSNLPSMVRTSSVLSHQPAHPNKTPRTSSEYIFEDVDSDEPVETEPLKRDPPEQPEESENAEHEESTNESSSSSGESSSERLPLPVTARSRPAEWDDLCQNVGVHCIPGTKQNNPSWVCQDSQLVLPLSATCLLIAVFDGHGYYGHIAADIARAVFSQHFAALPSPDTDAKTVNLLRLIFRQAHLVLARQVDQHGNQVSLYTGTTATVAILDFGRGKMCMAHVGDSRLLLASRGGLVEAETFDHVVDDEVEIRVKSKGGEVRTAEISGIAARRVYLPNQPFPGIMMGRSLGDLIAHQIGLIDEPEITSGIGIKPDNVVVLASDGLWEHVTCKQVAGFCVQRIRAGIEPRHLAQRLAEHARSFWPSGHSDDITVIVCFTQQQAPPCITVPAASPQARKSETPAAVKVQLGCVLIPGCSTSTGGVAYVRRSLQSECQQPGEKRMQDVRDSAMCAEASSRNNSVCIDGYRVLPGAVRLPGFSTSLGGSLIQKASPNGKAKPNSASIASSTETHPFVCLSGCRRLQSFSTSTGGMLIRRKPCNP